MIVHSNTPGDVVKGNQVIGNTITGNGFFKSGEMGGVKEGIALIGNVTPVQNTTVTGNIISQEDIGIGYTSNSVDSNFGQFI